MAIIGERGLEALTMSALGQAVGASAAGLYRYFPSKEAILVALQEQAIEGYAVDLTRALDDLPTRDGATVRERALERVAVAFGQYARHAQEQPARHRVIDAFLSSPRPVLSEDAARRVDASITPLIARCAATLDEAQAVGAIEPGDNVQRTVALWGALHGLDHFRKRDRIQPDALRTGPLASLLIDSVLRGFGADPEQLHRVKRV